MGWRPASPPEPLIGTPGCNPPPDGTSYSCFDGELENRRISLVVEGIGQPVEVVARGIRTPGLRLNATQAVTLFGLLTRELETAVGVVL
ncbi:MAG: hypothetical protein HC897_09960 [Thermoanaerobaculia bacterium]|nr:hypothetical protein [Thermoanaerobaculia bacterium]